MAYKVLARFYSEKDQFGEGFVIVSDNDDLDMNLEIGEKVVLERVYKKKLERKYVDHDNYSGGICHIDDW